jgi:hypothetical protein
VSRIILPSTGRLSSPEADMTDPAPPPSLKRVWIWALVLIVVVWIVYAVTGGTSTPSSPTTAEAPAQR